MTPSDLPADDQILSSSPLDQILQLELQQGIQKLFYESCDQSIHDLLSKCEWNLKKTATALILEISCFDLYTFQALDQTKEKFSTLLKKLFTEQSQININFLAHRSLPATPIPSKTTQHSNITLVPLADQIRYLNQDIHRIVLSKDQRGQFSLLCLSAGEAIPTHASLQGTALYILEGQGVLEQQGHPTLLQAGHFIYISPKTTHTLKAIDNLAVLCAWI